MAAQPRGGFLASKPLSRFLNWNGPDEALRVSKAYFGTDGIRGTVGRFPMTAEFCLRLGWTIGKMFAHHGNGQVLVGKDTRVSGYMLESALESGLLSAGADVGLTGPMPTPAVAYLTRTLRAAAGIVISASHNPYRDNGIKVFDRNGNKLDDELEAEIETQLALEMTGAASDDLGKAVRIGDVAGRYIEFCKGTAPRGFRLQGLHIVVDCAHGATYHVAPGVFEELGARITLIGASPDGFNINQNQGSSHPEQLAKQVAAVGADLGIAFDGDGDRVVMADHKGEIVDGDELLYLIAFQRQRRGSLGGGVVGTAMSNAGLEHGLQGLKIPFLRSKVGDRYVLELLRQKNWVLGGEPSGHILCLDLATTGDGIVAALQALTLMVESGRTLHELKSGMSKLPQVSINVDLNGASSAEVFGRAAPALDGKAQALGDRFRILIRPSGTEPLLRVTVEGEDRLEVVGIAEDLAETVRQAV